MEARLITNRDEWEQFLRQQPFTPFVQSWSHGLFYKALGESFWVVGLYNDDTLVGGSLILSTHAKRGSFLFLPYGPICSYEEQEPLRALTEFLRLFAKEEGYDFIRISPFIDKTESKEVILRSVGYQSAPMHMLAENTWLLDVTPSEETLLANMNKNHRNLIHRCEREGVRVDIRQDRKALDEFNDLHDITVARHGFHRYSRSFITTQFEVMSQENQAAIFHAYLPDGTLDASAVIIFYGTMAAYYHGASCGADKKVPVSYLLQWRAIQEVKKRGMVWYNFWGVAPPNSSPSHPFAGITHFKKGFGGIQKDLIHCHDFPLRSRYRLNWLIETLRRQHRGFRYS